jgi:anti-sigma-K factor RskA
MEERGPFISSCSRRQLARRKPTRSTGTWPLTIMMLALVVAVAVVLATRGIV